MAQEDQEEKIKQKILFRSRDLKVLQADTTSPYSCKEDWEDILPEEGADIDELFNNLGMCDFQKPSSIQGAMIPLATKMDKNRKFQSGLAQAQNGSGKTLAFVLTSILRCNTNNCVQVIILVPTYELALQTADYFDRLAPKTLKYTLITSTIGINFSALGQIIIATPGCLFSQYKHITNLDKLKVFIIDECDEVVENRSYHKELLEFSDAIRSSQFLLFSATLKESLKEYLNNYLPQPRFEITLPHEKVMNKTNEHFFIRTKDSNSKIEILSKIFQFLMENQTFIFVNSKSMVRRLQDILKKNYNLDSEFVSSDLKKEERKEKIQRFREEKIRVLITTDVLARGVDIPSAKCVINFDLPVVKQDGRTYIPNIETYLHRQGRCGRFGKNGKVISFVNTEADNQLIKILTEEYGASFIELTPEQAGRLLVKSS